MCQQSELSLLSPSVLSVIQQTAQQLRDHRRHMHPDGPCDDLEDCTWCNVLERRLAALTSYRDNGGVVVSFEGGLPSDQNTQRSETPGSRRGAGTVFTGYALQGSIDRALASFGAGRRVVG